MEKHQTISKLSYHFGSLICNGFSHYSLASHKLSALQATKQWHHSNSTMLEPNQPPQLLTLGNHDNIYAKPNVCLTSLRMFISLLTLH